MGLKLNFLKIHSFFLSSFFLAACGSQPKTIVFKPHSKIPEELVSSQVELVKSVAALQGSPTVRLREFKINRPQMIQLKNGSVLPKLEQGQILSQFNRPRVPILRYSFEVPKGMTAKVSLVAPELEKSEKAIELAKTPKPLVWGKQSFVWRESNQPAYYPGKLLETHQVGQRVSVLLYPVQVETDTGKVILLVKGHWKVELSASPKTWSDSKSASALIITSTKLLSGAKELQKFHKNELKVESEIETVESIAQSSKPISLDELPDGYKSPESFEKTVKKYDDKEQSGYDFETARKIIQYLRTKAKKSDRFKYVVLLGDSELVPPSYYFQEKLEGAVTTGVTDQCYGAGKNCLEPRLAVGRLPLKSLEEVQKYLKKASRWLIQRDKLESDLSLFGGRAFPSSPLYIGELGTLQTLNFPKVDWKGVQKYFETEGNFNKTNLEQSFSGKQKSALIYYLDHGLGNRLFAGEEFISSNDISKMDSLPESPETEFAPPVVVSVACINAAFDEALLIDETLEDQEQHGKISVGTALVKSRMGAIAYLGGSRDGLGSPETEVDAQGNVQTLGTSHGLQLLDSFIEKHRTVKDGRLGDALNQALLAYSSELGNDMEEFSHRYTYWITELLGDPLMPLPKRQGGEDALPSARSEFEGFEEGGGYPQLPLDSVVQKNQKFMISSSSSSITAKIFEMELGADGYSGQKLVKSASIKEAGESVLPLEFGKDLVEGKHYLIKLINDQGVPREQHVVFYSRP